MFRLSKMTDYGVVVLGQLVGQRGRLLSAPEIAEGTGLAGATVSQVLSGSYRGDMVAIESAVKGALMGGVVFCPAFHDEIPQQRCQSYQRRPFSYTNAAFNRIWRACRGGCPHSRLSREEVGDVVE